MQMKRTYKKHSLLKLKFSYSFLFRKCCSIKRKGTMKYIFVVILSILIELSVQTPRNVVNNKTEETVDSKIVINVEYTNFQKKVNEVSNEKTNGKKLITETEDIVEEFFIATINPNETADSENEGTTTESFDDEESAPVVGTFRSDSNETAVSESSENKTCSENEIFIKCGPRCYQTCTFQSVNVRSSRVACDSPCIPGCYCASGYVRFNEKCVLPDSCPSK